MTNQKRSHDLPIFLLLLVHWTVRDGNEDLQKEVLHLRGPVPQKLESIFRAMNLTRIGALVKGSISTHLVFGVFNASPNRSSNSNMRGVLSESNYDSQGCQMPRHLVSDAHRWTTEIPRVPICYVVKTQQRERARDNWGERRPCSA